jgi:hypothetical protein
MQLNIEVWMCRSIIPGIRVQRPASITFALRGILISALHGDYRILDRLAAVAVDQRRALNESECAFFFRRLHALHRVNSRPSG